jgi:hypothetical protein
MAECAFCGTAIALESTGDVVAGAGSGGTAKGRAIVGPVRTTVLMRPDVNAVIEAKAAERDVSSGEYIRLAVSNFEKIPLEDDPQLAALVAQANTALGKMEEALDHSIARLQATHEKVDALLREAGIRN